MRRHRTDIGEGREVAEFGTGGLNNVHVQIFIAVLVVEKHDVTAVRAPILPVYRPALGACNRLSGRDAVNRGHPDVQDAVNRGKPRQ